VSRQVLFPDDRVHVSKLVPSGAMCATQVVPPTPRATSVQTGRASLPRAVQTGHAAPCPPHRFALCGTRRSPFGCRVRVWAHAAGSGFGFGFGFHVRAVSTGEKDAACPVSTGEKDAACPVSMGGGTGPARRRARRRRTPAAARGFGFGRTFRVRVRVSGFGCRIRVWMHVLGVGFEFRV